MYVPSFVPDDLCEPVADAIDEIADLISNNNWTKGVYHTIDTEGNDFFCLVGGIRLISEHTNIHNYVVESISRVLGSSFLTGWNDDPSRTEAEVIGLLSDTAAILRGESLE